MNETKQALKRGINEYLWSEQKGAYFPYSIAERKQIDRLMASTFYPLRLCIADNAKQKRLIDLLKEQKHFNWGIVPITSMSMLDKEFTTTRGSYMGNASWSGNVWTLINEMVVRGLLDCQQTELASELALQTVYIFNHNLTEFVNPFDKSGQGVKQYAWTASQWLELIIEVIFGVSYDAKNKVVTIKPNLAPSLKKAFLKIENLKLSNGEVLTVQINNGKVDASSVNDSKIIV